MAGPDGPRTVLYVHSSAGRYGADRQLALLVSHLDPDRYRAVAVLPHDGPLVGELSAAGAEVDVRPGLAVLRRGLFTPSGLARVLARAAADARALARLARRRGVRLVHTNTSVTLGGAAAARAARLPHVWHVREIYADFARWWPAYRRLLLSADAVPCLSEATRAQFGAARNALVIPEGLPDEATARRPLARAAARSALDLPEEAFTCLVLGRLNSWKGQEVLVEALARLGPAAAAVQLVLAGDIYPGDEPIGAALRRQVELAGLQDRVVFPGFADPQDVLAVSDIIVSPSTRPEPFALAVVDALCAGRPVIASAHGGHLEQVRDGVDGLLVPPGDAGALAQALLRLLADAALRRRMAAAAHRDRRRFSLDASLPAMWAIYGEALAGP